MLQYLSDRMYDEVRGQGLTYGVSMSASVTEGRLTISLTRSSRLTEAYRTVQEILERYITRDEETVEDLVGQAVKAYMRKTDSKYNRQFVRALGRVQLEDLKATAKRLLPAFLSADTSM